MTLSNKEYKRIPGRKNGLLVGYGLWQAKDHLLQVYSRFGIEDYKRFYFADIQGIVTRKTIGGKIQNAILGGFILLFGLMALFNNSGMIIFHGIFVGIMMSALLINIYKGPSCETHLFTAVQTEKLPTLNRLKIAIRIMERLRPLIEHSQRRSKPARSI